MNLASMHYILARRSDAGDVMLRVHLLRTFERIHGIVIGKFACFHSRRRLDMNVNAAERDIIPCAVT